MVSNVQRAIGLGYLRVPQGMLIPAEDINRVPAGKLLIICTGSQGEPTSALTKIANGDHPLVLIQTPHPLIPRPPPAVGNQPAGHYQIQKLPRRRGDRALL